ncbi:hypothetical protein CSB93_1161 [Pseudomonas paraeruginosa]|uniref:Uncharacterized protein n=1 Tax=Pseudomonas paraeruginosa TaxID=2994495 RepID=A0A2R3J0S7_9PSED|nr:hypothetical protein CSB93_1161 [Pseudomonas paraeruginosa]AWE90752.1 hypothetical protein CSC28_6477 [Pseudomonas paraeruginosa]
MRMIDLEKQQVTVNKNLGTFKYKIRNLYFKFRKFLIYI